MVGLDFNYTFHRKLVTRELYTKLSSFQQRKFCFRGQNRQEKERERERVRGKLREKVERENGREREREIGISNLPNFFLSTLYQKDNVLFSKHCITMHLLMPFFFTG